MSKYMHLPFVRSHCSLFYFHHFSFVDDCCIFTVADWSRRYQENKKVSHDFLHTVVGLQLQEDIIPRGSLLNIQFRD